MTPANNHTESSPGYGQLQTAMIKQGHRFFDSGDYNLNLIGIRSKDIDSNAFNDVLVVAFRTAGRPHVFTFPCTTNPGLYWRLNPATVNGTAIVKPGQYRGLWQLGKHQGKYEALVQRTPITVYRDNTQNATMDINLDTATESGRFGINCHRATPTGTSTQVDKWSAGCQVLASAVDFSLLLALCRKALALYGNSFTYTLLDEAALQGGA